jgi:hypothetical protein
MGAMVRRICSIFNAKSGLRLESNIFRFASLRWRMLDLGLLALLIPLVSHIRRVGMCSV